MRVAGSARGAQNGQSIRPCQLRHGRARYQVHRQCGRQRLRSSCGSGLGSRDRAAVPSCGRMRKTLGARRMERLGVRGECDRPLKVLSAIIPLLSLRCGLLEGTVRLPRKRIMGWRPWWRILVAFIVNVPKWAGRVVGARRWQSRFHRQLQKSRLSRQT
jgi:hypothetical protein